MNFVLDTNVLVSAAIFKGSIPDKAFDKARFIGTLISSESTYAELREVVVRSKFDKYFRPGDRAKFLAQFRSESTFVFVTHRVSKCKDSKDDMFLELALSGKADAIISSDPDLLILHPFENIAIISPKEFLKKY